MYYTVSDVHAHVWRRLVTTLQQAPSCGRQAASSRWHHRPRQRRSAQLCKPSWGLALAPALGLALALALGLGLETRSEALALASLHSSSRVVPQTGPRRGMSA